jgi:hypothetical protein
MQQNAHANPVRPDGNHRRIARSPTRPILTLIARQSLQKRSIDVSEA